MERDELIPIKEAALRLSVCRQAVARRVAKGELQGFRSVKDARAVFIRASDIDALQMPRPITPRTNQASAV
jgi:hypothetical protein